LKHEEELKFIPINLHVEQFLVESKYNDQENREECYDFTSVGAFTSAHVAKASGPRSVEILMKNSENNKSDTFLIFFALKIFILILNDLKIIKNTDDKIQVN
jgi:hypothetical protein